MATHNTGEPKCPECGKKFARMASLKSHMVNHEKEESLFCTECEDAFLTKVSAIVSLANNVKGMAEFKSFKAFANLFLRKRGSFFSVIFISLPRSIMIARYQASH